MFVFIAHAEADQAAADELKAFLKTRGLVVETETGARGFRHLQASDVVIALWSQKSVFGAHRMMMEKRMLDAWADERLVLVKLDHGLLPVGMRDLAAIDASFESGRALSVWPQVERAAKEAMNAALVAAQRPVAPAPPEPERETTGTGSGRTGGLRAEDGWTVIPPAPAPSSIRTAPRYEPSPQYQSAPEKARGAGGALLMVVLLAVAVAGAVWLQGVLFPDEPTNIFAFESLVVLALLAIGLLIALRVVAAVLGGLFQRRERVPSGAKKEAAAPAGAASAPQPATAAMAEGELPAAVFISYAHADADAVQPVVAIVERSGRSVWIDKGGIQAGEGWAGEIVRGIKGARRVMIMCSPRAFESDHIKREVYLADRYKKPMLPVFIAEAQPPEDFEYFFAGVQWLELFRLPEAERPAAIGKALGAV
jgi:hypothetical protein